MAKYPVLIIMAALVIAIGVQISSVWSDGNSFDGMVNAVCGKGESACREKAASKGADCYSMLTTGASRAVCFEAASDELDKEYYPQVQTAKITPKAAEISGDDILAWAGYAVPDVLNFDAQSYSTRMQNASKYFTKKGWAGFLTALDASDLPDVVKTRNLKVSIAMDGAPTLGSSGKDNGVQHWSVKCPATINYRSATTGADELTPTKSQIVLQIVADKDNPNAIGIEQWLVKPVTNP